MQGRETIMVVEDDISVRQLIAGILREVGHEVVECANGAEALSRLDTVHPSLITLDLSMPFMDGYQFLQALRGRADAAVVPVVFVTAAPESLRLRLSLEGHDTIKKPFHLDQLLAAVERALGRRLPAA